MINKWKILYDILSKQDLKKEIIELCISDNEFYSEEQSILDIDNFNSIYNEKELDEYIKIFTNYKQTWK